MIKKNLNLVVISLVLVVVISFGLFFDLIESKYLFNKFDSNSSALFTQKEDFKERGVNENRAVYENEIKPEILELYVTVAKPSDKSKTTADFETVNNVLEYNDYKGDQKFDVIFQHGEGDIIPKENFGYSANEPNATIEIRGHSTRRIQIKSYKIKLEKKAGTWLGNTTINLNKHPYDMTRVRNKLSFDYLTKIPNITSLRTQFARLYVKDLTKKGGNYKYEDYGLYTYIEQPNKGFLMSHGLDPSGNLYKAESFEFLRYEDNILNSNDPKFNKDKFEEILESKNGKDHSKLIQMLNKVNDYTIDIDDVIDKYFDKENYLTWLAVNILFGNNDTNTQNFYLYTPMNSNKWYFLPWDYDGAWGTTSQVDGIANSKASWEVGISNYWGVVLHRRFAKNPENIKALNKKIEELGKYLNNKTTKELLDSYYPLVSPIIKNAPDIYTLPANVKYYDDEYKRLETLVEENKKAYYKSLERPLPVFIGDLEKLKDNVYKLSWDLSFDLQGDDIFYDVKISENLNFENSIVYKNNYKSTSINFIPVTGVTYYCKIMIKDSKNNYQVAFDKYTDEEKKIHFGVKKLEIK